MHTAYEWNAFNFGDAQAAGEKMEELEARDGFVTKETYLDAARPEDSSTHHLFEWDNEVAGEKWRLHISANIINNLRVVIRSDTEENEDPKEIKIRAFEKADEEDEHTPARYVNITRALSPKGEFRDAVIANLKKEMKQVAEKARVYEEFSAVVAEIDKL